MKKLLAFLLVLTFFICFAGCRALQEAYEAEVGLPAASAAALDESASAAGLAGIVNGSQYINAPLGFTAAIPEGWLVAADEEIVQLYSQAQRIFAQANIPVIEENVLLFCSQYHNSNYNPTIVVETVDYVEIDIESQKEMLQRGHEAFYASRGVQSVEVSATPSCIINDADYLLLSIADQFETYTLYQNQYYIARDEYWLIISQTWFTNAQKDTMDAFMQSIMYT